MKLKLVEQTYEQCWNDTVRYYSLRKANGEEIGGLFTDFFARPNKRGGAWMDVCSNHSALGKTRQLPIAHLVCNFSAPFGETPSLLTHNDVVTLFHEFGHSIHHLLTEVEWPSLAGINGVAWDAVELPSQFLENFAYLPEVLDSIGRHYESNESLPPEVMQKLQRSRTFLAGLAMVRQLEFGLFDFLLHSAEDKPSLAQVHALMDKVRNEVAVIFRHNTIDLRIVSRTYSPGDMRPDTTATNGLKCSLQTPLPPFRKPGTLIAKPHSTFAPLFSRLAAVRMQ